MTTVLSKPQSDSASKGTRNLTGKVVSVSMKDTVVVLVSRYKKFPKYGKHLVRTKRIKAHDAGNTCAVGDIVTLKPTRPISKEKHFEVVDKKAPVFREEAGS